MICRPWIVERSRFCRLSSTRLLRTRERIRRSIRHRRIRQRPHRPLRGRSSRPSNLASTMTPGALQRIKGSGVEGLGRTCRPVKMSQQQKPDLTCETAKELVLRLYGLKVLNIREMVSFDDRNFHIQVSPSHNNPHLETLSPNGYTLKVSNPINTAKLGHFASIHYALKFLHEKGLRVPLPVTNLRGSTWSTENLPILPQFGSSQESISYASCGIHVFTYISGNTMDSVPYTEDILQQWGRLLGQFHNSLEDFSNEHLCNKDVFWSIYHLSDIAQLMEELEKEKSELVSDVLRSYDKEIKPLLWEFRKGYIHGDFNETNVLIRKTAIGYIVDGILDFEDMHYGPYVWDVGLMLAYVSLDSNDMDPIEAMGHSLAGYLQLRTLSSEEISLLKLCIACRLCQSLVLGAHSYRLDPSNSYLIRSSRSGWSRLKLIWNTPNEIMMERWKDIRERLK